ncbi:oligosaccharide flippase family protein [Ferruginibacter lapsinanis]|uniref:lipopolysaccharide biosynthesis protein n=1 Tax=Ferruginibacter lapsinanis TaxID=563172 RepID=UPI001E2B25CE|nr:oligosaccharide flippase family protein [Ferruginibacter lapsinanis]UEG50574.1 oligosaccharide flippase family protein [Ferruginibacter lapsinanis]
MDLFERFKKDYFNYLVSFILPALVTGISIPVFKRILGSDGYGNFSIWFNLSLICVAILGVWITNSILRFYAGSENKVLFIQQVITIAFITQLFFCIPISLLIGVKSGDFLLGALIAVSILSTAIQFTIAAVSQSAFLSRKIIFLESIRVGTYLLLSLLLLLTTKMNYLYALFIGTIISYIVSAGYLYLQISKQIPGLKDVVYTSSNIKPLTNKFLKYGAPLSFWFAFSFLLGYIDKIFMAKNIGATVQGNYQAIFDLLSRGITILIYPVVTSLYPILTVAYEKGEIRAIKNILKKILLYELAGFVFATVLYWLFGADLLLLILKTPNTLSYKMMGFIVIAGTFIWQMAMVIQKHFELKLKSFLMLKMVVVAFAVQFLLYIIWGNSTNEMLYPLGYLLSAIVYLVLVSYSEFIVLLKKL